MGADKTRPLWIGDSLYIFEAAEGGGGGGGGGWEAAIFRDRFSWVSHWELIFAILRKLVHD